jgi:hypothetical protein
MTTPNRDPRPAQRSEFADALRKGLLAGAAILLVVVPSMRWWQAHHAPAPAVPPAVTTRAPQPAAPATPAVPAAPKPAPQLADFAGEKPSADARLVANWVTATNDAKGHAFVLIDKKDPTVYVFDPKGKLLQAAPALLGSAKGDDSSPGIGDKPLSQIKPWERTTPAGRFVAEPGMNNHGEDIVWISYDLAVSMHRWRVVKASEHRKDRLFSATKDDNRISNGCVNLPHPFYEQVLKPTVDKYGAIIYVLPETRSVQEQFGAYDVTAPQQVAQKTAGVS